jgi:hypothetical protein
MLGNKNDHLYYSVIFELYGHLILKGLYDVWDDGTFIFKCKFKFCDMILFGVALTQIQYKSICFYSL